MHYQGGKARHAREIASFIKSYSKPGQQYIEPFAGALSITQHIGGPRIASDINKGLITTYKAMQDGWEPPEYVTKEEYAYLKKHQNLDDPLTALAGVGFSFCGRWFGGCITDKFRIKCRQAQQVLIRKIDACKDVEFRHCSYLDYDPEDCLIYMDPPYRDTAGYAFAEDFNHDLMWDTARKWSKRNTVLVSEYTAPDDFISMKRILTKRYIHKGHYPTRTEHIWMHKDHQHDLFYWPPD